MDDIIWRLDCHLYILELLIQAGFGDSDSE